MSEDTITSGSFRDRRARVYQIDGQIYRYLDEVASKNWRSFQKSALYRDLEKNGDIVATSEAKPDEYPQSIISNRWEMALKHEKIEFISYPYEWSFHQLKDAALFHLDILQRALKEGMIIKDSSAYNIQWRGVKPVFIDVASFENLPSGEPWVGYKQFCEMFLNPLMLAAYKKTSFQPWMRGRLNGIETVELSSLMSLRDFLRRGVFFHVYLHAKLQESMKTSDISKSSIKKTGFGKKLIHNNAESLKNIIRKLDVSDATSHWVGYTETHSYKEDDYSAKKEFIENVCAKRGGKLVWDLGCNTGDFSLIAAKTGSYVVAMDADENAVSALYERCKKEGVANVLPLNINLVDPSPSQGWRNEERLGLEKRGKPYLVLALALIHHVVITNNVPLPDFVAWLAALGGAVALEFVSKEDEMVKTLLKNKEDIYDDYSEENLEYNLKKYFEVAEKISLKGGLRTLYFAKPKTGG